MRKPAPAGHSESDRPSAALSYLGWATVRRYGFTVLKPAGDVFFASSSETAVTMMTAWPCFPFTGVAPFWFDVRWQGATSRSTSSKLRPVDIGYVSMALTFLSGPMTNTDRTVALSAGVRPCAVVPAPPASMSSRLDNIL